MIKPGDIITTKEFPDYIGSLGEDGAIVIAAFLDFRGKSYAFLVANPPRLFWKCTKGTIDSYKKNKSILIIDNIDEYIGSKVFFYDLQAVVRLEKAKINLPDGNIVEKLIALSLGKTFHIKGKQFEIAEIAENNEVWVEEVK